jgi:hypothetical protein
MQFHHSIIAFAPLWIAKSEKKENQFHGEQNEKEKKRKIRFSSIAINFLAHFALIIKSNNFCKQEVKNSSKFYSLQHPKEN